MRGHFQQYDLLIYKILQLSCTRGKELRLVSLLLIFDPIVPLLFALIVYFLLYLEYRKLNVSFKHRRELTTPKISRLMLLFSEGL